MPNMVEWIRTLLGADPAAQSRPLEKYLEGIPRIETLASLPSGTPVLVRGDLDAKPGAKVGEGDIRLRSMVETIRFGQQQGWKQVVFGHIGRKPEGSLKAVAKRLAELIGSEVPLVDDWYDDATGTIRESLVQCVAAMKPGAVVMLENTRKYKIERVLWDARPDQAAELADKTGKLAHEFAEKVAQFYVNEALSAGSLDSSTTVVPAAMKQVALGKYVAHEFDGPMRRCLASQLVVFSGLKTDKLDDLEAMINRGTVRWVFTAGSLAMALKKADAELNGQSFSMGLAEDPAHAEKPYYIARERIEQAKKMLQEGRAKGIEFVLPVDFVLQDGRASETIGPGDQQFDIGPKSSELFSTKIGEFITKSKQASGSKPAAFHNGVFGMFEDPRFAEGTKRFVGEFKRMTDAGVDVYVGGGEGGTALELYGQPGWVTHCFTAGGTVLNALGSAPVPYLVALYQAAHRAS
jgi:phosphoglycerate kinase